MSVTSGWGRLTWDQANWGDATTLKTGWGAQAWDGSGGWGDLSDQTVILDGQAATTSLGSTTVEINVSLELSGQEATSNVGDVSTRSDATFTLSGQAATSSVDSVVTEVAYDITTAGVATTSVGSVVTEVAYLISTGNRPQDNMRGVTGNLTFEIGQVLDSQVATFATPVLEYSGTLVGWGRDAWGDLSWGDSTNKVVNLVGLQADVSLGQITEIVSLELNGQEATTDIGSLSFVISPTQLLDGQEATVSQGDPTLEFAYTLSGQSSTSAVGTPTLEFAYELDGQSSTVSLGTLEVGSAELVDLTGVSATSSAGSISPTEMTVGIDGAENTGGVSLTANGNAQLSTATKKFGTASLLVDGTGDFVKSTNSDVINGDFTIEFFAYASSFAQDAVLWDQRVGNSGFAIGTNTSSQVIIYADGSAVATGFSGFNNNAFNHIAFVRNGGVLTVYVNGTSRGTAQTYNTNYTGQPYYIGSDHTETDFFTGNIDEFRASSVARYTSAFTPPSSAFTVDNDTTTLLHFDGSNGSTNIVNEVSPEFVFEASTATGSFDIADVVQGLVTDASTGELGILGIQHFQDLPTGSNTSYSDVAAGANSSIAAVDTGSNTSYSDASTGSNSSISDVATGSNTSYSDVA
mgnify:CR=1 FL=1